MRWMLLIIVFVLSVVIIIPFITLYISSTVIEKPCEKPLDRPITVRVFLVDENKTVEMSLGNYLTGVVAGEMPAAFDTEALKAQAVAARTYTYKRLKVCGGKGCAKHPEADVCTDSTCCQAYLTNQQMKDCWGSQYKLFRNKVVRAIKESQGLVLTYQGIAIDPVFHSTCGGKTENSENVWSNEVCYLRSVVCPYCNHSPKYSSSVTMSRAEVARNLGEVNKAIPVAALSASVESMAVAARTSTGRVATVKVGNVEYTGVEFRSAFGLNSTNFTWNVAGDSITFRTIGYGHGVGLCQYGAQGMALKGYDFKQILHYYYQGVKTEPIPEI